MKLKVLILLIVCLFGLCVSQQAFIKLTEEEIQEQLKERTEAFYEQISQPENIEQHLNYLKQDEYLNEDQKCLHKQQLKCKEENRLECLKKSYYQQQCTNVRCGFQQNEGLAEVYGSCVQRQCISDLEEVQNLSLQTYQCLYAAKYNPESEEEQLIKFQENIKKFEKKFDEEMSTPQDIDAFYQIIKDDETKTEQEKCLANQFFDCQKDRECIKQANIQLGCVQIKCNNEKEELAEPEIFVQCIQQKCKNDTEQFKKLNYEYYQCLYFAKYNQYDDKYVLEETKTTNKASHSSLIALSLVTISLLLV
ncbi:hypothetical protein ABPG72_014751 [Tetrahymena utriculariae]